jgi:hypothetical protein
VSWDQNQYGSGPVVWAIEHDSAQVPGLEINLAPGGFVSNKPDVTGTLDGWFVVHSSDGLPYAHYVDASGMIGPVEVDPDASPDLTKTQPDGALRDDGTLAVIWHWHDPAAVPASTYFVRHIDTALQTVDNTYQLAQSDGVGSPPDIAATPDGGTVAAWVTRELITGETTLWAARMDGSDTWQAPVIVQSPTVDSHTRPMLAVGTDQIVVAWRSKTPNLAPSGAWLRIYDLDLNPLPSAILLEANGNRTSVAALDNTAVVAWENTGTGATEIQAWDLPTQLSISTLHTLGTGLSLPVERPALTMVANPTGYQVVSTVEAPNNGDKRIRREVWDLLIP